MTVLDTFCFLLQIHSLSFFSCPVLWGLSMGSPAFQLGSVNGETQQETRGQTLSEVGVLIPQLPPRSVAVGWMGFQPGVRDPVRQRSLNTTPSRF